MITSVQDAVQKIISAVIFEPVFGTIRKKWQRNYPENYAKWVGYNERVNVLIVWHLGAVMVSGLLPAVIGGTGGSVIFCVPVVLYQFAADVKYRPKEPHPSKGVSGLIRLTVVAVPVLIAFYLGYSLSDVIWAAINKADKHH